MRNITFASLSLALAGCVTNGNIANEKQSETATAPLALSTTLPTGSTASADGFLTIENAPADLSELKLFEHDISGMEEQARIGGEQQRLFPIMNPVAEKLRRYEKGNFTDFYIDNDGPKVMFIFLFQRDGAKTLAKYTKHPQAVATTINWSQTEREAERDLWLKKFFDVGIYGGGGLDIKTGIIEIETGMTHSEFDAIAKLQGWTIPTHIKVKTQSEYDRPSIDEKAKPFVRFFPQTTQAATIQLSNAIYGKLSMRDGCIYIEDHEKKLRLAQFDKSYGVTVDREGYLALQSRRIREGYQPYEVRIGEQVIFSGVMEQSKDAALLDEAEQLCGTREMVNIATPGSFMKFNFRDHEIRALMERNKWSEAQAVDIFRRCVRLIEAQAYPNSKISNLNISTEQCADFENLRYSLGMAPRVDPPPP